ncbi:MAG: hypothetical protein ACLFVB_04365 [Thermoplasmata archaeon]
MSRDDDDSSVLEMKKFLGVGWEPVSVRMKRNKKGPNFLEQTITLSLVRRKQAVEGEENFTKDANLLIRFLMGDPPDNE